MSVKINSTCFIFIGISVLVLTSCTHIQKEPENFTSISAENDGSENISWHSCSFRITWPEGSDPDMDVDLLLAHAIIGPILTTYKERLQYWRFHRRAVRDDAGHSFRFIFFTDRNTAIRIFHEINISDRGQQLQTENIIEQVSCNNILHQSGPYIADTSDKNWSFPVQKNWPSYIMGVSKLWLGLIDDVLPEFTENQLSIRQMLDEYRKANKIITNIWQMEGQHAFLHHLNAIFGYESLLIRY